MHVERKAVATCFALVCLLGILGCSKEPPKEPTYRVEGKVTYQGRAVPHGAVTFHRDAGHPFAGQLQEDGSYALHAAAGAYRVGIVAFAPPPPDTNPETAPPTRPLVPRRYNRPDSSGITFEVKPSDDNRLDLPLK